MYLVYVEDRNGEYKAEEKTFDTYDEALEYTLDLYDSGVNDSDFEIENEKGRDFHHIKSGWLYKCKCSNCYNDVRVWDLNQTKDYYGIPFRYVCEDCYKKLMSRGYDGQKYSELDENINLDY